MNKLADGNYEIEGSPATCVNISLYNFASECDFVVAGPNVGHNLGRCALAGPHPATRTCYIRGCDGRAKGNSHRASNMSLRITGLLAGLKSLHGIH